MAGDSVGSEGWAGACERGSDVGGGWKYVEVTGVLGRESDGVMEALRRRRCVEVS